MFGGAATGGGPQAIQGYSLLASSHQLRAEFTFLLRCLDTLGTATKQQNQLSSASQGTHTPNSYAPSGTPTTSRSFEVRPSSLDFTKATSIYTYVLEVVLALARFDPMLTTEERKLLIHGFDSLLSGMLHSLHQVRSQLRHLDSFAEFLKGLAVRAEVLDHVDWHRMVAQLLVDRHAGTPNVGVPCDSQRSGSNNPSGNLDCPTPLVSPAAVQPASLTGSVALPHVTVDAASLYANILLFGEADQGVSGSASEAPSPLVARSSSIANMVTHREAFQVFQNVVTPPLQFTPSFADASLSARDPSVLLQTLPSLSGAQVKSWFHATFKSELTISADCAEFVKKTFDWAPVRHSLTHLAVYTSAAANDGELQFETSAAPTPLRNTNSAALPSEFGQTPKSSEGGKQFPFPTSVDTEDSVQEIIRRNTSLQSTRNNAATRCSVVFPDSQMDLFSRQSSIFVSNAPSLQRYRNRSTTASPSPTRCETPAAAKIVFPAPRSPNPTRDCVVDLMRQSLAGLDNHWSSRAINRERSTDGESFDEGLSPTKSQEDLSSSQCGHVQSTSQPLMMLIDDHLDSIAAVRKYAHSMLGQIRSEITLLCFRVVSSVIDLLLPAAEARGKALALFYRKWLCDVYRVLLDEKLLDSFSALVNRARQTGVVEGSSVTTSSARFASALSLLSPTGGPRKVDGGLEGDAFDDEGDNDFSMLPPTLERKATAFPMPDGRTPGNGSQETMPFEFFDADLDKDENEAVGALFRTYRGDDAVSFCSEQSRHERRRSSAVASGATSSAQPSDPTLQQDLSRSVLTLFRSLHGSAASPPSKNLGTRLLFTLLNGTDVNATDLKDVERDDSAHSEETSPVIVNTRNRSLSALVGDEGGIGRATRGRSDSVPASPLRSSITTPRRAAPPGSFLGVPGASGLLPGSMAQRTTTTMLAMPHHHRFKYPVVRNVNDVRGLFMALLSDSEQCLSPHDPLRAAIVLNTADFCANAWNDRHSALDIVSDYLLEVESEAIQEVVMKACDMSAAPVSLSQPSKQDPVQTPMVPPSGFSVTTVRRAVGLGATGTSAPLVSTALPVPTAGVSVAAPQLQTQIPMVIPSWASKEEQIHFINILRMLKSAQESLTRSVGSNVGILT